VSEPIPGVLRVIGAGLDAASARLEKLSHTKWTMQTVSVRQFNAEEFTASFAKDHSEGFGVLFSAGGTSFVVFLSASSATSICRAFLGTSYKSSTERDAVAEVSNIVVNAMIDEIGDATGELLLLNAPRVVEGLRSGIMLRALESFRAGGQPDPIVSQVHMMAEGLSADCSIILLMSGATRASL
jgi:chemotaxis protein CheY-P-specific phosphatase CheC